MSVLLDSIEPLGNGICTALLHAIDVLQPPAFESIASPLIDSIEQLLALAKIMSDESNAADKVLESICDEIMLLASILRTITTSSSSSTPAAEEADIDDDDNDGRMEEDDDEHDHDSGDNHDDGSEKRRCRRNRIDLPLYAVPILRRCWPSIRLIAAEFYEHSVRYKFWSKGLLPKVCPSRLLELNV